MRVIAVKGAGAGMDRTVPWHFAPYRMMTGQSPDPCLGAGGLPLSG